MDDNHKSILQQYHQKLADDLYLSDTLLDQLVESGIFPRDMVNTIKAESTESDQVKKLLDLLPKRGPEAFGKFVTVIGKDHPWLAQMLTKAESGQGNEISAQPIDGYNNTNGARRINNVEKNGNLMNKEDEIERQEKEREAQKLFDDRRGVPKEGNPFRRQF